MSGSAEREHCQASKPIVRASRRAVEDRALRRCGRQIGKAGGGGAECLDADQAAVAELGDSAGKPHDRFLSAVAFLFQRDSVNRQMECCCVAGGVAGPCGVPTSRLQRSTMTGGASGR